MNDHLSDPKIILFQARALPSAEMMAALEHLAQCIRCRQRSHEHFQATNAYQASTITLSPALEFRHEHLDAEQVTALVNQSLDSEDTEIAQAHLQTCYECRSEVQSLFAFQEELKTELRHRYGPKPAPKQAGQWKSLWAAWQWKPVFAATFVAACLLTTILRPSL
jgi:predicted anti-sigma-YlaC factor YlaD